MKSQFFILFTFRIPQGFEPFARFEVGSDRRMAEALFSQLQGSDEVRESDPLYVELMETTAGLPLNLQLKSLTLSELCEDCRIITKEIFRTRLLEQ